MTRAVKVLLVEDDPWLAEVEAKTLQDAGFEVSHAPHPPAAIESVDVFQPDVIVLDVLLGGGTAFTLLHELQSYGDTGQIPIILCTNLAESLPGDELTRYGVRRVVDKTTMHPDDLVAAVRSVTV